MSCYPITRAIYQCEEAWNCSTVLTVQHASISENRHDMFCVTDTTNAQHTFQVQFSCKITDLENIEPEIIFLNQVVVYYFYLNLEYIEQFFNRSVISQADDREDAFRWVEAINAAQLSKAPQSSKLADSIALHTAKVNIIEILTFSLISN